MFNSDEINKIKEAFERLKNTSHIAYPYIDEKLNEVRRTEDNEFETFRNDSSSSAYKAAIGWKDQNYHYAYKEGFLGLHIWPLYMPKIKLICLFIQLYLTIGII